MAENVNKETTAVLAGGGVEYAIEEAAIEIDAQWASIRGDWSWASEG
jgi:hypothetical protein